MVPWLREFHGEIRRIPRAVLTVHMSCPDPILLSGETREAFELLRKSADGESLRLWSGGWSGAPAALLTREELEWEYRWSETNEEGTGLEQLLRRTPESSFPYRATPAQAAHLAHVTGRPVCGGYASPPLFGSIRSLWIHHTGHWASIPARVLDASRPVAVPSDASGEAGLFHLVHFQEEIQDPARLVDQLLSLPPPLGFVPEREDRPPPPIFSAPASLGSPVLLNTGPATASPLRKAARLNRDRTREVLATLSPQRNGARPVAGTRPVAGVLAGGPGASREYRTPEEFQGSTEGHLMMNEGPLTVRFASGRIAGITGERDGSTPARRAAGYLRERGKRIPRTSYLQTENAAWFSGPRFRGVEEKAFLVPPGGNGDHRFDLHTTALLSERLPGVLLSYALRFPRVTPEEDFSIALMQIPLMETEAPREATIEILDSEGTLSTFPLPPEPGSWTIAARLARFPLNGGGSLWIGSADPAQPTVIAMQVELARGEKGFLLSLDPLFRYDGVLPGETAGTLITGTLIIAPGSTAPETLQVPADVEGYLRSFSRTVPE